jgi:multidrug efflux system membrane fusion protein
MRINLTAATSPLIALVLAACQSSAPVPPPPTPVTVVAARAAAGTAQGSYSANIVAETQVDVAFKVNGYVKSILLVTGADGHPRIIQSGDTVKEGAVLAIVQDDSYRQAVLSAQGRLQDARAHFARAQADYQRSQMLYDKKVIAKAQFDASNQDYLSSKAQVDAAAAGSQQAQIDLAHCQLTSPLKGLVLRRDIEVGSLVAINTVGFQVGDTRDVKAVFGLPGALVGNIHPGSAIGVTIDAFPGKTFTATITKVSAIADPNTRVFDIEGTIANPERELRVGMTASMQLVSAVAAKPIMVVPMRAVVRPPDNQNGYAVYILAHADGQAIARLKPIVIGPVLGDQVSVESGIAAGDQVILRGADVVYDGQRVSVIP